MLTVFLKILCLAVYVLAVVQSLTPLPYGAAIVCSALALLVAHVLELAVFYRHVRKYPGSLPASIVLTLLFGLLHWLPLSRKPDRG